MAAAAAEDGVDVDDNCPPLVAMTRDISKTVPINDEDEVRWWTFHFDSVISTFKRHCTIIKINYSACLNNMIDNDKWEWVIKKECLELSDAPRDVTIQDMMM